jgi:hypothetical protein
MQIKFVILTVCTYFAAIGFTTPAPQVQPPSDPAPGGEIAHSTFDANGAPGDINEAAGAISLNDFADMQAEGSIPDTEETLLRKRRIRKFLRKYALKFGKPQLVNAAALV